MSLTVALDVSTAHRSVADDLIGQLDESELGALVMDLLRLYDHAGKKMSSELGWLATVVQLCRFADSADWTTQTAAGLIVAHQMYAQQSDTELRAHGEHELKRLVDAANQANRITEAIFGIIDIWRVLLPALEFELLEHFVTELQ